MTDPVCLERTYRVNTPIEIGGPRVWAVWEITCRGSPDAGESTPTARVSVAIEPDNFDEVQHDGHSALVPIEDVPDDVLGEIQKHIENDMLDIGGGGK